MSKSGRILSCRRGGWWGHCFLFFRIDCHSLVILQVSHSRFFISTQWPQGLRGASHPIIFLRCMCLDRQEVTGEQQIPMKHSSAALAILRLYFIDWTFVMLPLDYYMDFLFPE
ncbi:unnamed protein product [Merluccius merluccius]